MKLADVPPGQIAVFREVLGDARSATEIREVFYLREDGRGCRYPHNVPVARVGIIQGDADAAPGDARYVRVFDPPIRDPGEVDGRITVTVGEQNATWWLTFLHARLEAARQAKGLPA